jgi:hypothetical protein
MIRGNEAVIRTGMPMSHGHAFQQVANAQDCVIVVRAVGRWATGLLLEDYASKGFHNKAKSCNWGPMAGFVLSDPRLGKGGNQAEQGLAVRNALQHGCSETPLFITDERRRDLEDPLPGGLGRIARVRENAAHERVGSVNEMHYTAVGVAATLPTKFVLRRTMNAPGADGKILWAVLYGPGEVPRRGVADLPVPAAGFPPVMAIVDAACPDDVRRTYRAATTGDYDLWAVFPKIKSFQETGGLADRRMVPGSDRHHVPMSQFKVHEDEHQGNLTPRILAIKNHLNQMVQGAGYRGGDVVHHSDEAGRPNVRDIDFPAVAFIPGQMQAHVANVSDFRELVGVLLWGKHVLSLNPGWQGELGISVTTQGNYVV